MPKLTDLFIEKLPFSKERVTVYDSLLPAFGLRVGARSKVFLVVDSKGSRRKLGTYPAMKLSDARQRAREAMQDAPEASFRISDAIERYLDAIEVRHNTRLFYTRFLRKLEAHYGSTDLASLIPRQCAEITENPQMHMALKVFFNWCKGQALITTSPMENLKPSRKPRMRSRVLNDDELKRVWSASEQLGTFGVIIKLCCLTAQRRGELAQIKPEWLQSKHQSNSSEPNTALLVIPADVAKNGREHSLPISALSQTMLKALIARLSSRYTAWSKPKVKLDQLSGVADWTIHDLRRTTATNLSRLGTDPFIVERILNHSMPTIQQIYNRHDFTEAMRAPLQQHEDWLLNLVEN